MGLENAKIVKIEEKTWEIPQFKALIMPNFIPGPIGLKVTKLFSKH